MRMIPWVVTTPTMINTTVGVPMVVDIARAALEE
jgi:hypothetical protein